jgi:hypothetical protein
MGDEPQAPRWLRTVQMLCGIGGATFGLGLVILPMLALPTVGYVVACALAGGCLLGAIVSAIGLCVARLVEIAQAEKRSR